MTFKTQQDIWLHLAQGGAVQNITTGGIYKFENGSYNDSFTFAYVKDWQPYIEPPRKVKKTFYRRKWALVDDTIVTDWCFKASKQEFDSHYELSGHAYSWSDEWDEILIEVSEDIK